MRLLSTLVTGLLVLSATPASALQPWKGNQKALVVLVGWNNTTSAVTAADIETTFFSLDRGDLSLRKFFQENTHGAFDITGTVMNWRTSPTQWNPAAGCNLRPIVDQAWNIFSPDVNVADYDSDGNGKVDNFFVVHSGRINQDRVGPECTFTSHPRSDFAVVFQSEGLGSIGSAIPIGFYIHEGGHGYYSLPDLYADHYNGRYGIGMWGMMGLGAWGVRNDLSRSDLFRYPAHFEPLSKVRMGWVQPRVINQTMRGVEIRPVETTGEIVAVPKSSGTNYYLEYRSPQGFSTEHHGHGLLIWRNYTLIQADGRDDINHGNPQGERPLPPITENFGDDSDPFPGSLNVTEYADAAAGIRFENIVQYEDRIVLDIVIDGAPRPYTPAVTPSYKGQTSDF